MGSEGIKQVSGPAGVKGAKDQRASNRYVRSEGIKQVSGPEGVKGAKDQRASNR